MVLTVGIEVAPSGKAQWQSDVWNALYNAAQTQYYAQQQDIAAKISQLEARLNNVDTLTLRREESEEIMKIAIATLTGNWVGPALADLSTIAANANVNNPAALSSGAAFAGDASGLNYSELTAAMPDEDVIRFVNQAIEWESVVTFLYSYFWDMPDSWDFIRKIKHPDSTVRRSCGRAVREWCLRCVRGGKRSGLILSTVAILFWQRPYLTIAREIAAYDDRNYPGIPPANPAHSAVRPEALGLFSGCWKLRPKSADPKRTSRLQSIRAAGVVVAGRS